MASDCQQCWLSLSLGCWGPDSRSDQRSGTKNVDTIIVHEKATSGPGAGACLEISHFTNKNTIKGANIF